MSALNFTRIAVDGIASHILNCEECAGNSFIQDTNETFEIVSALCDIEATREIYAKNAEYALFRKVNEIHRVYINYTAI